MCLTDKNIKTISLVVNVGLAMVSVIMILIGIKILLEEPTYIIGEMSKNNMNTMAILNIIPSVLIIIVALYFGCYRVTHQKSPIIYENVKWLSVILSWTVFFAIFSYFYLSDNKEITKKTLTHIFNKYSDNATCRDYVDHIQSTYHCCGVDHPNYWMTRNQNYTQSCYDNNTKSDKWEASCVEMIEEVNSKDIKWRTILIFIFAITIEVTVIGILLYLKHELEEIEKSILKRQQLQNATL